MDDHAIWKGSEIPGTTLPRLCVVLNPPEMPLTLPRHELRMAPSISGPSRAPNEVFCEGPTHFDPSDNSPVEPEYGRWKHCIYGSYDVKLTVTANRELLAYEVVWHTLDLWGNSLRRLSGTSVQHMAARDEATPTWTWYGIPRVEADTFFCFFAYVRRVRRAHEIIETSLDADAYERQLAEHIRKGSLDSLDFNWRPPDPRSSRWSGS